MHSYKLRLFKLEARRSRPPIMENSSSETTTTGSNPPAGDGGINTCTNVIPSSHDMMQMFRDDSWSQFIIITSTIFSFLTCLLFVETAISIGKRSPYGARRGYSIFILGLVPVHSVTSLAAIYIPKASLIATWASGIYLAVSLYIFLVLMMNYFGGPEQMVVKLNDMEISLAQAPLACCCPCCCVKIKITASNLHRLRAAVLQQSVIMPLILFVAAILWADGLYDPSKANAHSAYLYLTILIVISTLVAMYALTVLNVGANTALAETHGNFRLKFSLVKAFMLVPSLQGLVITLLAQSNIIPCRGILSSDIRASILYNVLIVFEVFFLLVIGRVRYYFSHGRKRRRAGLPGIPYTEASLMASPTLANDGKLLVFPSELLERNATQEGADKNGEERTGSGSVESNV